MMKLPENSGFPAFVAQRIEHLTTDQKVGGSSPSKRTKLDSLMRCFFLLPEKEPTDVVLWASISVVGKAIVDQCQVWEAIE